MSSGNRKLLLLLLLLLQWRGRDCDCGSDRPDVAMSKLYKVKPLLTSYTN